MEKEKTNKTEKKTAGSCPSAMNCYTFLIGDKMEIIECSNCGEENNFDIEDDVIVCKSCVSILNIEETNNGFITSVV